MSTLLLSDLHLPTGDSPLRDGFLKFLAGPARQARRVYILGDLFEYWIGDDVGLRDYAREAEALRALVRYGVPVYFQRGNRDFLVGRMFCEATGVQLLDDPVVADLEGRQVLLSHGDLFCTDDRSYQRWRRFARNPVVQWLFLRLPLSRRLRIAGGLRSRSHEHKHYKPEDIMDVSPRAVDAVLRRYAVAELIHGHTHRPAEHALELDGKKARRVVLADWNSGRMEYLRLDASGQRRLTV